MPKSAGVIQSADRALRILEAVGSAPDGVSAREVSSRLGIALPTTYHLLATLVRAGYVVHLADDHKYALGYMVRALDAALRRQISLVPGVAGVLQETHRAADAPVYLALFRDGETLIADVADSPRRQRVRQLDVGLHEAPHATAFGKVMLSAMDTAAWRQVVEKRGLRALTRRSVTNSARLEEQLADVRRSGVAVEVDEFMPSLACLAVPVRDSTGNVTGALSISSPSREFDGRRTALERTARLGARQVSDVMRAAH